VRSGPEKKQQRANQKKKYIGQQRKEMHCDEPHLMPSEKTQPIQWTEWPTGALVAAGSLRRHCWLQLWTWGSALSLRDEPSLLQI
jgi:hypothetical protein